MIYFGSSSSLIRRPPNAIGVPVSLKIGNIIRFLNESYTLFVPSFRLSKPASNPVSIRSGVSESLSAMNVQLSGAKPIENVSIESALIPRSSKYFRVEDATSLFSVSTYCFNAHAVAFCNFLRIEMVSSSLAV